MGEGDKLVRYKYRSLRPEKALQHTKRIFTDHELYYSSPLDFNDPFECRVDFSFAATKQQKVEHLKAWLQRYERMSPSDAYKAASQRFSAKGQATLPKWEEERRKHLTRLLRDQVTICSLSKKNDDLLMWSHYADGHRGICIEFTPTVQDVEGIYVPIRVEYGEDFPEIKVYEAFSSEDLKPCVLSKAKQWEYEEEWRFVSVGEPPGPRKFRPGLMSGVILGSCTLPEHRQLVLELVEQHPTPIRVFEAQQVPRQYRLRIVPWGEAGN